MQDTNSAYAGAGDPDPWIAVCAARAAEFASHAIVARHPGPADSADSADIDTGDSDPGDTVCVACDPEPPELAELAGHTESADATDPGIGDSDTGVAVCAASIACASDDPIFARLPPGLTRTWVRVERI